MPRDSLTPGTSCPARFTIVCALEFEGRFFRRTGVDGAASVVVTGAGSAVGPAVKALPRDDRFLILAGLAGALDSAYLRGSAHWLTKVRGPEGASATPSWRPADQPETIGCQAPAIVGTPAARHDLRARTGGHLVDMESWTFAQAAEATGHPWAILRGIGDGAEDPLPDWTMDLVDAKGRSRPLKAGIMLLRHPERLSQLLRVARDGRQAMTAVTREIVRFRAQESDQSGVSCERD